MPRCCNVFELFCSVLHLLPVGFPTTLSLTRTHSHTHTPTYTHTHTHTPTHTHTHTHIHTQTHTHTHTLSKISNQVCRLHYSVLGPIQRLTGYTTIKPLNM